MTKKRDSGDRRQQKLRKLGMQNPRCAICNESDPCTLELHHIAGQKHSDDTAIICANCHRKLSDKQRDHVPPDSREPAGQLGVIGHYLMGLADLFSMLAEALRKFGTWLIGQATQAAAT